MRSIFSFLGGLGLLAFCSCNSNTGTKEQTPTQGTTRIVVDESLQPIIDDQLRIFNTSYPDGHIGMIYKPEVQALNLFLSDSINVAVLTRKLSAEEEKHFKSKGIVVRTTRFAIDGIALINQISAPDTGLLVQDVIDALKGKEGRIGDLVFDNANSSTFRYLMELAGTTSLPSAGVYALKSNKEVISYVAGHPNAVGVVGMNWIEQPDPDQEAVVEKVKYLSVKDSNAKPGKEGYFYPNQSTFALEQYPLMRNLYVVNCSGGHGLGTGFAAFVCSERGQRVVLLSGLLPDKLPTRQILINHGAIGN